MGAQAQASVERHLGDLNAGVAYLRGQPYVRGEAIGAMGFCFGGGMTWRLALDNPAIRAAVPFYGPIPPLDSVGGLQAAVLAIYAEEDPNVNARIPEMEQAMLAAGKTFEVVTYPGALHAFFNDSSARYNADASRDSWARTLDWFGRYLA